jgi:hypothetical protein
MARAPAFQAGSSQKGNMRFRLPFPAGHATRGRDPTRTTRIADRTGGGRPPQHPPQVFDKFYFFITADSVAPFPGSLCTVPYLGTGT